jgi:hypothetical protein
MPKFRITVTQRSEEWSKDNPPLQSTSCKPTGAQSAAPDTPGRSLTQSEDTPGHVPTQSGGDTPGYSPTQSNSDTPGYGPTQSTFDTPGYAATQSTVDTPGYGQDPDAPLSPLSD